VSFCGQRLRVFACLFVALMIGLALVSAKAFGGRDGGPDCTAGASSIRAVVVDGRIVESQPHVSGCIPERR
jgi:hypothetical protein